MTTTVEELMEMRRRVKREMPHIDCHPVIPEPGERKLPVLCTCYKLSLNVALIRAEMSVRDSLGMEPF